MERPAIEDFFPSLCQYSEIINKMELIEVNIYIISYFGIMTSSCPKSLKKNNFHYCCVLPYSYGN